VQDAVGVCNFNRFDFRAETPEPRLPRCTGVDERSGKPKCMNRRRRRARTVGV